MNTNTWFFNTDMNTNTSFLNTDMDTNLASEHKTKFSTQIPFKTDCSSGFVFDFEHEHNIFFNTGQLNTSVTIEHGVH